jgi:hypothetical protein
VLGATALVAGIPSRASEPPSAFRWFVATPAPARWKHLVLRSAGAVLSYPPSLERIASDKGSVSVARKDRRGTILVYLNATPKQGAERLSTWPAFRIRHNRGESNAVHEDARAYGLSFLDGSGSCVLDDYVTRVKDHHYREIACLVENRANTASVLVAAALRSQWTRAAPLLERAVTAYRAERR